MPRAAPSSLLTYGLRAAVAALSLAGASSAWAQGPEVPRQLPPVTSIPLSSDSFDVRAFDPLGLPSSAAPTVAAMAPKDGKAQPAAGTGSHQEASLAPLPSAPGGSSTAMRGPGKGMFSDGWSRNGFGSLR